MRRWPARQIIYPTKRYVTPLRRRAEPEKISAAVAFLASDDAIVMGLVAEAAVIGMVAGGIGALVGTAGAVIVSSDKGGTVIPWTLIAGALALAFFVNGLGAMLPAWAATRTVPIRAIRDV